VFDIQIINQTVSTMLTLDKITGIYCIVDDSCKEFAHEFKNLKKLPEDGKKRRNRSCEMSDSEMMTVLLLFHFGTFLLRSGIVFLYR
jgi:hypothetical protein